MTLRELIDNLTNTLSFTEDFILDLPISIMGADIGLILIEISDGEPIRIILEEK